MCALRPTGRPLHADCTLVLRPTGRPISMGEIAQERTMTLLSRQECYPWEISYGNWTEYAFFANLRAHPMRFSMLFFDGVVRVVFLGVDVSGKTTAIQELSQEEWVRDRVAVAPEAASILVGELGCQPPFEGARQVHFQRAVAGKILMLEHLGVLGMRDSPGRDVLLCDRGLADGAAYIGGPVQFAETLGFELDAARRRYSGALYFDPPSEEVYDRCRPANPGRIRRTYVEVMALHEATLRAWEGHPNLHRIPSFPSWEEKLAVARECLRLVLSGYID